MPHETTYHQPHDALLSAKEVAKRLDISVKAARQRMSRGIIPSVKMGRLRRVRESELSTYIASLPRIVEE